MTALVTGASGGIGLEFAKIFAENGVNLILVARSGDKLQALAKDLQGKVKVRVEPLDLSDMKALEGFCQKLDQEKMEIDYLVNNAGFGDFGFFADTDWKRDLEMIQLNIISLTYLTKFFIKRSKGKSGKILNVASTAAFQAGPTMAVYYATKAYVLSLSEAIANELKGTKITVTTLCPGATQSGFQKAANLENSRLVKGRRLPTSAEVARFGYKAMMRGDTVAIHGALNFMMVQSLRFMPRKLITKVVRKIQEAV